MSTCQACGGVIGRDCYNPAECMEITRAMASQYAQAIDPLRDATEEEVVQAILDAASHGEGASETNVINAFLANRRRQGQA